MDFTTLSAGLPDRHRNRHGTDLISRVRLFSNRETNSYFTSIISKKGSCFSAHRQIGKRLPAGARVRAAREQRGS